MKDSELQIDHSCHVLYSKPCKKEILAKITLHYPEVEREAVWEQVQLRYAELLSKWRTDLGGKKNFHNGVGGTYDCIAIMSYYKFSPRTSVSRIPVVTELAPDATYDVIFVVLRYTQLNSVLYTLRANRTKNIVFVGNNVQARALAAALPGKNVLFAFALSAGHREPDRVVSIDLKKITIGQLPGTAANKQLIGRIFHGTKYKVAYEPNMEDYLLCHAAFVMPAAFACYKTDGDLKKLRGDTAYLNRLLDANIEGYRAIRNAGHTILPKEDADFEGEKYRRTCLRFFKLMCATSLGKLCASDHAMNAIDEMSALNRDLRKFFDEHGAAYPVWQELEAEAGRYLQ